MKVFIVTYNTWSEPDREQVAYIASWDIAAAEIIIRGLEPDIQVCTIKELK